MSTPTATSMAEDEIDLRELFLALWEKKHIIAASAIIGLVLAAIYAFLIAKPVYESSALLLPTQTPSSDQMGAAAALLGKKSSSSGDADLYQSLLTSRTVIHKLLQTPIHNGSDTGKGVARPLYKILGIDTSKPMELDFAIEGMAKCIIIDSKENTNGGILEIHFTAATPWLAQQIGSSILNIGQEEFRQVRIERSNVILSRLNVAVAQAKNEWDSTARALMWYKDRNRSIQLPDQMLELSRLEIEKSAKEQKYLLARKEYETQLLEQAKAAPPMMILDKASLPSYKIKPKRMFIVATGFCSGLLISAFLFLLLAIFNTSKSK